MTNKSALAILLTLSFTACYRTHRTPNPHAPEDHPPATLAPSSVETFDQDYHLFVVGKNWNSPASCLQMEPTADNLLLSVETVLGDPSIVPEPFAKTWQADLWTGYGNYRLPRFTRVTLTGAAGDVDASEPTESVGVFSYLQTAVGNIKPTGLKLGYHTETIYPSGVICHSDTTVVGKPRTLRNHATLDGVYTLDYWRYAHHESPTFTCPGQAQPGRVSYGYRLDVYDRGDGRLRLKVDHGELEFTLDRYPVPGENYWFVRAKRGRFWDPYDTGWARVHGKLEPGGRVDLTVQFLPDRLAGPSHDPPTPQCYLTYRLVGDGKRLFKPDEVDGYWRVREEIWDQCNTWPTNPPRVVTEYVLDIVANPWDTEFKLVDNEGFVDTFPLFVDNSFSLKELVTYNDGSPNGVKVTLVYHGSFDLDQGLLHEDVAAYYPRGCATHRHLEGRVRRFSY